MTKWKPRLPTELLSADGPAGELSFRTARALIRSVLFRMFNLRVEGQQRLQTEGAVIFAPVHRSHLDGPLIGGLTRRRVRYLGKEELFHPKPLGWFIRSVGTFPVKRGEADLDAMRAAKGLLDSGEAMLVFPEGTRQETDTIGHIYDGTAWLAAKSGSPVVPIGIAGTREAMPSGAKRPQRAQVGIVVGEPMAPPIALDGGRARRADMTAWTMTLQAAIGECQQQARALAERPGSWRTPRREVLP